MGTNETGTVTSVKQGSDEVTLTNTAVSMGNQTSGVINQDVNKAANNDMVTLPETGDEDSQHYAGVGAALLGGLLFLFGGSKLKKKNN